MPRASYNGRIAGVAIGVSAVALTGLALQAQIWGPLTILFFGTMAFGVWAFCDEMGTEKPLVRAGMVAFMLAIFGRVLALVMVATGPAPEPAPGANILYAIAIAMSILLWSIAFLHRSNIPKVAGLVGVVAGSLPVLVFVLGHVLLGTAVVAGSASLWAVGASPQDFGVREVEIMDYLLSAWGLAASWLLLTGRVVKQVV